jgi:hypothetical protein
VRHLIYLVVATAIAATLAVSAAAHPDHGLGREAFPGEGVVFAYQHGATGGHLPAVNRNVRLVGKAAVTNPSGAGNHGRIADVSAYGNYAYLTAFRSPTCVATGAHTIDISNPQHPFEVTSAFLPTTPGNYAGEGSQTLRIKNANFDGVIFLHQNETCPNAPAPLGAHTRGGINIWDITQPLAPALLAAHAGDYTAPNGAPKDQANQTHSMFAWNTVDGKTYVVLVDDEEVTDVDIMDITDPRNPVMVNDQLELDAPPFSVGQDTPKNLTSIFSHDMTVKRVGNRYVMNMSYWDGGYVLLDVTDPRPGNVTLIAQSDYALLDEQQLLRGRQISPEGNAHQSELSRDNKFLLATDEDFNPYRVIAKITSGPYVGTEYAATSASGTPPIDASTSISGTPTFVGNACGTLSPVSGGIALVERGVCTFQVKFNNIRAAGYSSGIVFNTVRPDCMTRVTMLADGDRPFVFVDRLAGLQLLQVSGVSAGNACTTASPGSGTSSASTTIEAVFDGWGYVRLFSTTIPGTVGTAGAISQVDTYAIPESQDPAYATGFGALSVHEVAMDPENEGIAYISYYSGGFRVVEYGAKGIKEVGAFIDQGGNDFWGVEVHRIRGAQYVLASDRDYGLYIFQYEATGNH